MMHILEQKWFMSFLIRFIKSFMTDFESKKFHLIAEHETLW